MGWTSTDARFYTADGKVNRKAECDALYTWEGEKTKNEVIKSSMRGSVYYAAVRTTDKTTGHSEVFAAVCLTSTRRDGGFNFGYKGMAEDMGPCEDDCPKGILVLLTDTESKYAKEWRERCWAKIRDKKQNRQCLASIKIGEIIEFERGGVTIRAEKMAPAYQFKTPWFKVVGEFEYVHKTEIKDWRIVADNAATPSETPQISTETAETANVSAEGEKEAERAENKPYYTHRWRVLHNCDLETWDKFHKKHKEAILIFHHETTYAALQKEAVKVSEMCDIAYEVNRHGVEVCLFNDATLTQIIEQGIYVAIAELPKVPDYGLTDAPQSPEAPQTVEYTTDTPKPRETARKPQNRGIGNTRHSRLGAGGYEMLDNASATLTAMSVPRECSTTEAAYW